MSLFYKTQGSGAPLVLLHGYLSDSNYWKPLLPELSKRYTVITIDLLGFGRSPKPGSASYTLDEHATAVATTIMHITSEPAIIAGHSMGALIAAQLTIAHPKLITRTLLCNMPLFRNAKQAREAIIRTSPLHRTMLYSPIARIAWPIVKSFYFAQRFTPGPSSAFSTRHNYRSRTLSLINTIEATNAIDLLLLIDTPTVLINGTYDRSTYRKNLKGVTLPKNIDSVWVTTGHHTVHYKPSEITKYL